MEELEKRLRGRNTETEDKIAQRLAKTREEISYSEHFDVILVNDDLEKACKEAEMLVTHFLAAE